jgi:hypothetical protein
MICFVIAINSFLMPKNFPPSTISIYMQLIKSWLQKGHNLVQKLLISKYQNLYQKTKIRFNDFSNKLISSPSYYSSFTIFAMIMIYYICISFFCNFTRILLLYGSFGCKCAFRHEKVEHDVKENIVNILKAMWNLRNKQWNNMTYHPLRWVTFKNISIF